MSRDIWVAYLLTVSDHDLCRHATARASLSRLFPRLASCRKALRPEHDTTITKSPPSPKASANNNSLNVNSTREQYKENRNLERGTIDYLANFRTLAINGWVGKSR